MKKNKLATILTIAIVSVLALTGCGSAETREDDLKAAADKVIEAQEADDKETEASKDDKKSDARESGKEDTKKEEKSGEKKAEAKAEDKKESAKTEAKADTASKDSAPSANTASKPSTASTPASAKPSTSTASATPSAPATAASKTEAPKGCTHVWKDNYQTVTVKAAWDEQVLVSAAWDETIVDIPERTEYTEYVVCHGCGYTTTSGDDADRHVLEALIAGRNCGPWGTKTSTVTIPAVTHVEHHDAVYQTVHHDAETVQQKVSTTCTKCGATK